MKLDAQDFRPGDRVETDDEGFIFGTVAVEHTTVIKPDGYVLVRWDDGEVYLALAERLRLSTAARRARMQEKQQP